MRKLILFLLFVVASWYGWTHYKSVLERRPPHAAVIQNHCGVTLERIRLKVDGQTLVKEQLASGEEVVLPFRVNHDSSFELVWGQGNGERTWAGGLVTAGPMTQRHIFTVDDNGEVLYRAENK